MEKTLEEIIRRYRETDGNVIFLLQETQDAFGYIPREAVDYFSSELNIPGSRFYGVVTFYSQFRLKPTGENKIVACCGTACHVRGSEKIINNLKLELGLNEDEDTTQDGKFTLEEVACLGTCSFAPVVLVNGVVRGKAGSDALIKEIRELEKDDE
jgi:NADH:ubiquinone oxidoreductase subunit E